MELVNQQHRIRHFEAQVVKCRDVEALQDLAIRLFAERRALGIVRRPPSGPHTGRIKPVLSLRTCL